jgi:hypothetical protein
MRSIKHALSGAIYDLRDDGTIEVSKDGRSGVFTATGTYLSGDIRHADPHLCLWIAGPTLPNRFAQAATALSEQETRPT